MYLVNPHYFLAVPVPQEIKKIYMQWQELVKETLLFKSWVHPEDYHITLAFLGDTPYSKIEVLKTELKHVIEAHSPFQLQFSHFGIFGQSENPRILWSGVENPSSLGALQLDVYQACKRIGLELESRTYHPHMTLARRWLKSEPFSSNEISSLLKLKEKFLSFSVNEVVLYRTNIHKVPKYEQILIFPLGKN